MKSLQLTLAVLACLITPTLKAAETATERFYGKITAVDTAQKSVTVRNKKQNTDARFQWNDQTALISNKKAITPAELKVGQSLIVSYVTENDLNKAKKITVREPFKKAAQ